MRKQFFKFIGILSLILSGVVLFAGCRFFVVRTGSMEPKIPQGSIIVVKPAENYQTGEVITYRNPKIRNEFITHRIYHKNMGAETSFITKGDANRDADLDSVFPAAIIGRVIFTLPGLGNIILFFQQFPLIILPVIFVLILLTCACIKTKTAVLNGRDGSRMADSAAGNTGLTKPFHEIAVWSQVKKSIFRLSYKLFAVLIILIQITQATQTTNAFMSDKTFASNNIISAATFDFSVRNTSGEIIADFFDVNQIIPDQWYTNTVLVKKEGTLDVSYGIKTVVREGLSFCSAIRLKLTVNNLAVYDGPLSQFNLMPARILSGNEERLDFQVELDDYTGDEQRCSFDFLFHGGQVGNEDTGFSREARLGNNIYLTVQPGVVVINELMWMGSFENSAEEWIELKNTTDNDIDLSGWKLTKKTDSHPDGETMYIIPEGKHIKANGYFLISHYSKENSKINIEPDSVIGADMVLRNENMQIKLYSREQLIDSADDGVGSPLKGEHGSLFHRSMARNDYPGDGTQRENWGTTGITQNEVKDYWDGDSVNNQGTPGGRNLF